MAYSNADQYYAATLRNSTQWPPHWRKVIKKIERINRVDTYELVFVVLPANPEWEPYWQRTWDVMLGSDDPNLMDFAKAKAPPEFLPPIEFETIEELDAWARVAARLST